MQTCFAAFEFHGLYILVHFIHSAELGNRLYKFKVHNIAQRMIILECQISEKLVITEADLIIELYLHQVPALSKSSIY